MANCGGGGRGVDTAPLPHNVNDLPFHAFVWGDAAEAKTFLDDYCRTFSGTGGEETRGMYLGLQKGPFAQPGVMRFPDYFDENYWWRRRREKSTLSNAAQTSG